MIPIVVSHSTAFPPNCHRCNTPTRSQKKITEWSRSEEFTDDHHGGLRLFFALFTVLFSPVGILLGRERGSKESVSKITLTVPTCESCKSIDTPVIDFNSESAKLRIAVHKRFADTILRG